MASASTSTSSKIGHGLAKVLGIKLQYRTPPMAPQEAVTRGESVFSVSSADTYVEEEPHTMDWLREVTPGPAGIARYFRSLFPVFNWLGRYNLQWLTGDLIAGVTIGAVVVPQGMAYAKLAELDPEFGLYTAVMGPAIYWLFGTSKDINIGPVAVMSTVTGTVVLAVASAFPDIPKNEIAGSLGIIAGAVCAFLGLFRLGFIIDLISLTAITSFINGAALNIGIGQIPSLLGLSKKYVNSRGPTYLVIIDTLKNLKHCSKWDVCIGLTALAMLYIIRSILNYFARRNPSRARLFFFLNTLRTVFVILLYTLISWASQRERAAYTSWKQYKKSWWSIVGPVPRGFQYAGPPRISKDLISAFASYIPVSVIVMLIEHIAISKSFGRVNNYIINPSQELTAIGVANLLGPLLGGYPATGSFSRTAIKSKAGVRTPLSGIFTVIVIVLAVYALPAVFYWIPTAGLSAVIIHAVFDLITPPNVLYQFWRINPIEVLIWFVGTFVTVFVSIEDGIYCTIAISAAVFGFRVLKARGRFLGRVKIHSVVGDHILETESPAAKGETKLSSRQKASEEGTTRTLFLPIDHRDGHNPEIDVSKPYPGIFIYRFSEGFNYPNVNHYLDHLVHYIFAETRKTNPHAYPRPGDRPWNDPGPKRGQEEQIDYDAPTLKAIILDFSSVNNVDVTSVQNLIDVRNQLDRWASPETVEWHFTSINNRWTKRALTSAGFGYPAAGDQDGDFHRWKPLFSVAEIGGSSSAAADAEREFNRQRSNTDEESHPAVESSAQLKKVAVVNGVNRPFFHLDIYTALQCAIQNLETKKAFEPQVVKEKHVTDATDSNGDST